MGASHHPFLKLLVLFLGISYAFFSSAAAVPATRSVKVDAIIGKTEPFSGSASQDLEGEGEGWFFGGRMELEKENDYPEPGSNPRHLEKENDYPEPGSNPRHDPPPNPSRS